MQEKSSPNKPNKTHKLKREILPVKEGEVETCLNEFDKGYDKTFNDLSPAGREYMRTVVEATAGGDTALIESLYSVDYDHKVVSPKVFFTNPDYMGHWKDEIFDAWWEHLLYIAEPQNGVSEVVFTGSFGTGKSTVGAGLLPSYYLHRVLCLKDPAAFYGLGKKSKIVFGIYSLDLKSAEDVGFYILRDQMIGESPFFNCLYQKSPYGTDELKFPKSVVVMTGSQALHAAGKNIFFIAIDEMNLMSKGKSTASKAYDLANDVSDRLFSRFLQTGGTLPGATVFLGSARSQDDFIEKKVRAIQGRKGYYVVRGNIWEYCRDTSTFSGEMFRVQVGNQTHDSSILDRVIELPKTQGGGYKIISSDKEAAEGCQEEFIPIELFPRFISDIDKSLQNLAGVSTKSFMKLLSNKQRIAACETEDFIHPFPSERIQAYVQGLTELHEEINKNVLCRVVGGQYVPRRHPDAPRYIHVDLAKNDDMAGVCMVHPSSHFITVDEDNKEISDGLGTFDIRKLVEVDFCIAVASGPDKQPIDFANIRRLIFLIKRMNFWIRLVTFDSWQSEDSQ